LRHRRNQEGRTKNSVCSQNGVINATIVEQNAMKTLSRFVTKFTSLIGAVLYCSDRDQEPCCPQADAVPASKNVVI
jgi:hypothetical protein